MKKKIVSLCLVVALVAIAIVGGTLAYFTDTDSADNTFTVGNVKIQLIEQERDGNGGLKEFTQDKVLLPIVGSAQGEKDALGMPVAENYVDKIITVKNTGASEAYIRLFIAVPYELQKTENPSENVLHGNFGANSAAEDTWEAETLVSDNTVIDGIRYKVYSRVYKTALAANGTTGWAYKGFYLDKNVDMNGEGKYTMNGEVINFDFTNGVTIPVFAQAIQAAGFENAEEAFGASGLPTNPWAE